MMRSLAFSRAIVEPPVKEVAADFGFDPLPEGDDAMPDSGASARIAPAAEPDPAVVQRLRSRLAEIRLRAEMGGVVRSAPARISPSVPVAAPQPPPPDAGQPAQTEAERAGEFSQPTPATVEVATGGASETATTEAPAPSGGILGKPSSERVVSPFSMPAPSEIPPHADLPKPVEEIKTQPVETVAENVPRPPVPMAPPRSAGLVIPEGPLAVRLDAYRRWLESECGLSQSVVFDRHGCPLHPAEGQSSFIAAAVSLGVAWREACALTDPPGTLRAVHSAWGTGTMAVIPVPTRFADLYVAGQVGSAIEPERAAEIGSALRRTAGV